MGDYRTSLIAAVTLPLIGCGGQHLQVVSWEQGQNLKSLAVLNKIEKDNSNSIQTNNKIIHFANQKIDDLIVEDSFVKKVQDKSGNTFFAKAAYFKQQNKNFKSFQISSDELKKRYAYIPEKYLKASLKVLVKDQNQYKPAIKIQYIDDRGVPWTLFVDSEMNRISEQVSGANLFESKALLFPDGPRLSKLHEILIKTEVLNPFIAGLGLKISSTIAPAFDEHPDHALRLSPDDLRFDQIQVFHYISKVRNWIRTVLGVQFNRNLDVELHVGAPQKTNAAFYYSGKIRLGTGDDEYYSKIPQDPSIVSHEVFHSVIEDLARLPYEGEGGSLNEAFADFFTALYLDRPFLGDNSYLKGPYKRTVDNNAKWGDKAGGLYGDSLIISGLLWQTTQVLGKETTQNLALETLIRLSPVSDFNDFNLQYRKVLYNKLSGDSLAKALSVMKERGFPE